MSNVESFGPLWSERKLAEYHNLKAQHDRITKRLKALRKDILATFEVGETTRGKYTAKIELRRSAPKIDDGVLWQILTEKNLIEECTIEAIDHGAVKQAFIEGKITDDDLRAFNLGSSVTPALTVSSVEDEGGDTLSISQL